MIQMFWFEINRNRMRFQYMSVNNGLIVRLISILNCMGFNKVFNIMGKKHISVCLPELLSLTLHLLNKNSLVCKNSLLMKICTKSIIFRIPSCFFNHNTFSTTFVSHPHFFLKLNHHIFLLKK